VTTVSQKDTVMKTSKIAGLIIAGMLAVTPAALAAGLDDMHLPSGRLNNGSDNTASELKSSHRGAAVNFYAPADQSGAKHWHIRLDLNGYPFGFAVVSN
jgi:hypothetical protein